MTGTPTNSAGSPADGADELVARLRAAGCVFAEDEAAVLRTSAADTEELERMTRLRVGGEPLEYVVGWAAFAGLRIVVEPGVFVPRRRTELVAELALEHALRTGAQPAVVVDLCCGAGAIGAAVLAGAARVGRYVRVVASDLDPVAVRVARRNLESLGGEAVEGDLLTALPAALRGHIDVLAVNAPYVPTAAIALMPPEARDHETTLALDGGPDGLELHRRIAAEAAGWLAPGGCLVIEVSEEQSAESARCFAAAGFVTQVVQDPERDATVLRAHLPAT
ncbi:MAG TPA: putative protein N(5)-glutamine methyltransferase [Candidatus Lumbricidophila sp.]|nr:putative protein N(5)-glutamine methyltransferase [Candidatus Lumbricidophila sp.]